MSSCVESIVSTARKIPLRKFSVSFLKNQLRFRADSTSGATLSWLGPVVRSFSVEPANLSVHNTWVFSTTNTTFRVILTRCHLPSVSDAACCPAQAPASLTPVPEAPEAAEGEDSPCVALRKWHFLTQKDGKRGLRRRWIPRRDRQMRRPRRTSVKHEQHASLNRRNMTDIRRTQTHVSLFALHKISGIPMQTGTGRHWAARWIRETFLRL